MRKLSTFAQVPTDPADPASVAQPDDADLRLQRALGRRPPTRLRLAVAVLVGGVALALRNPLTLAYAGALFSWWAWILVQYRSAKTTARSAGVDPSRWMGPPLATRWLRPVGLAGATLGVVLLVGVVVTTIVDPLPGSRRGRWKAAVAVVVAVTDGRASVAVTSDDLITRSAILPAEGRGVGDKFLVWIDPDDPLATEPLERPDWFEPAALGLALLLAGVIVRRRRVIDDGPVRPSEELLGLLTAPGCLPSAEVPLLLDLSESSRRSGQTDDAIRAAREAIGRSAGIPNAHLALGRALRDAGELAAAKTELETAWATRHDGVHFVAAKELAATWAAAGSPELADAFNAHARQLARRRGLRDRLTVNPPRRRGNDDDTTSLLRSDVDREVVGPAA